MGLFVTVIGLLTIGRGLPANMGRPDLGMLLTATPTPTATAEVAKPRAINCHNANPAKTSGTNPRFFFRDDERRARCK